PLPWSAARPLPHRLYPPPAVSNPGPAQPPPAAPARAETPAPTVGTQARAWPAATEPLEVLLGAADPFADPEAAPRPARRARPPPGPGAAAPPAGAPPPAGGRAPPRASGGRRAGGAAPPGGRARQPRRRGGGRADQRFAAARPGDPRGHGEPAFPRGAGLH